MRTTRFSSSGVGGRESAQPPLDADAPPEADPPEVGPHGGRPHPLEADHPEAGYVTCDACWEANRPL